IAAVSGNTSVEVRSATTGRLSLRYPSHPQVVLTLATQAVLTLAWSPDGKYIASGGADGSVQVWNATTAHTYVTYRGHTAAVNALVWSPDGKYIASGGADSSVQVWDATTGHTLFTYHGHTAAVNAVEWQKGPHLLPGYEGRIASGGTDATV